jgi:SAM-dependent methyltransferase
MPTSSFDHVSSVMHIIEQAQPGSILDVGVGFGKWGILCREMLEAKHGRLQPADWRLRIDGIEIHAGYENPLWHLAYGHIFRGDATALIDDMDQYDLIVAGDVIEHLDKDAGKELLRKLVQHGKLVVVATPRGYMEQGELLGNEYEAHRSGWEAQDLAEFPHVCWDTGLTFVAAISSSESYLNSLQLAHPLKRIGLRTVTRELFRLGWKQIGIYLRIGLHLQEPDA